ncbi:glycosyltransferase [Leptolyngbya sp. BC1307]|uniref:glycosyltransferase n=1 Tax=Leptolyngbya sp. BC1307 TaxID=2029589 RepID=UPI000EFB2C25|nr:glycosyltransferase [Leptolyngbya sp. BC1307]
MKVLAWPAFKTRYKNPYGWLLYSHMPPAVTVTEFSSKQLLLGQFDIFHLHWPVETLVRHPNIWVARLRVLLFWLLLKLSKWRGTQVIWTIHDQNPHVVLHQSLADWFQRRLIANTDGYINLCAAGQTAVRRSLPGLVEKPGFVIPHGHYRGCYPDDLTDEDARSRLNLAPDTTVLLYLGYISPYKNVPHLAKVFCQLSNEVKSNVTLLIAGQPDSEQIAQAVRSAADSAPNIQLHLRFVRDEELQIFFKAADLVVLPFKEILNSGSLLLALSFNRPVLAPDLGAVSDWQAQIGSDWIKTYSGALTPAVLQEAIDELFPLGIAPLESLNWEAIAQQTLVAYQALQTSPSKST